LQIRPRCPAARRGLSSAFEGPEPEPEPEGLCRLLCFGRPLKQTLISRNRSNPLRVEVGLDGNGEARPSVVPVIELLRLTCCSDMPTEPSISTRRRLHRTKRTRALFRRPSPAVVVSPLRRARGGSRVTVDCRRQRRRRRRRRRRFLFGSEDLPSLAVDRRDRRRRRSMRRSRSTQAPSPSPPSSFPPRRPRGVMGCHSSSSP